MCTGTSDLVGGDGQTLPANQVVSWAQVDHWAVAAVKPDTARGRAARGFRPVVNAQVLTNPDWDGSLTRYFTLASLAGGAAIAATPTLYAVTSRIQQPSQNRHTDSTTPSVPDMNGPARSADNRSA